MTTKGEEVTLERLLAARKALRCSGPRPSGFRDG